MFFNAEEHPYYSIKTKSVKKDLSSDQIKKLVDVIVVVDEECGEIYSKDVYPSIFIDQLPSRARTGDLFQSYEVIGKLDFLHHKVEGEFILKKVDGKFVISEMKKKNFSADGNGLS